MAALRCRTHAGSIGNPRMHRGWSASFPVCWLTILSFSRRTVTAALFYAVRVGRRLVIDAHEAQTPTASYIAGHDASVEQTDKETCQRAGFNSI